MITQALEPYLETFTMRYDFSKFIEKSGKIGPKERK